MVLIWCISCANLFWISCFDSFLPSELTSTWYLWINLEVYLICYLASSILFSMIKRYSSSFNSPYLPFNLSYSFSTTYRAVAPLFSCSLRTRILSSVLFSFYNGLSFNRIMFLLMSSFNSSLNFLIISLTCSFILVSLSIDNDDSLLSFSGNVFSTRSMCLLEVNSVIYFFVTLLFPIRLLESFDLRLFRELLLWIFFGCWLT